MEHKQLKLKQQISLQTNNGRMSLSSVAGGTTLNATPFNRCDSIANDTITDDIVTSPPQETEKSCK